MKREFCFDPSATQRDTGRRVHRLRASGAPHRIGFEGRGVSFPERKTGSCRPGRRGILRGESTAALTDKRGHVCGDRYAGKWESGSPNSVCKRLRVARRGSVAVAPLARRVPADFPSPAEAAVDSIIHARFVRMQPPDSTGSSRPVGRAYQPIRERSGRPADLARRRLAVDASDCTPAPRSLPCGLALISSVSSTCRLSGGSGCP